MKILIIDKIDDNFKKKLLDNNCTITEKLFDSKEKILKNFNFDGLILRSRFPIDGNFIKQAGNLKFKSKPKRGQYIG